MCGQAGVMRAWLDMMVRPVAGNELAVDEPTRLYEIAG